MGFEPGAATAAERRNPTRSDTQGAASNDGEGVHHVLLSPYVRVGPVLSVMHFITVI